MLLSIIILCIILLAFAYYYDMLPVFVSDAIKRMKSSVKGGEDDKKTNDGGDKNSAESENKEKSSSVESKSVESKSGKANMPQSFIDGDMAESNTDEIQHSVSDASLSADYNAWIQQQALTPDVVKNHAAFLVDWAANPNKTGKTFSPAINEIAPQVPWVGLRGPPQAVPITGINSAQVQDIDMDWFPKQQRMRW